MNAISIEDMGFSILNEKELINFNGGSQQTYNSGYAAGQYVQKIIAGVGILEFFYLILI